MPFGYVAVAGVTGYMASKASDKASDAADRRAAEAGERSAELLAFEKEKYDEWKDIYGDVEQNLADFYEDLTPEFLISSGLQEEAQSFATAQTKIKSSLAQRGLDASGLEAGLIAQQEIGSAEKRAEIRRDAPLKVAQMQQEFLQPNLARKQTGERNIATAMAGGASIQDQIAAGEVSRAEAESSSLWQSTGTLLSTGLKQFANQPDTTTDIKKV